ncbi:hypothetical protein [Blastopirellula marina]|uniref:Cytochrome c domain-containing protein n=1 Tax=Blastopirellula marina TaxID=124 RepID=A0A2S8GKR6_9BACT|nr:hypothetical protein [Blastopirellula marina]PQO44901.1 hypothetical protein C5Y93_17580 [Blastopirellula marina]
MFVRTLLTLLIALTTVGLFSQPAHAIPYFWEVFQEKYVAEPKDDAGKKFAASAEAAKCNVCHVDGESKKQRNAYGQAMDELVDKANFGKDRLKSEGDAAKAELIAALEKIGTMKLKPGEETSPTFAANIAAGNLPTEAPKEEPAPEPKPEPMPEPKPEPAPMATPATASGGLAALSAALDQLKAEIKEAAKAQAKAELKNELKAEVKQELKAELAATVKAELMTEMRKSLTDMAKIQYKLIAVQENNPMPSIDDASEEEAIKQIVARGGRVNALAQNTDEKVVTFHLSDKPIDDEALALVRGLRNVVEINARGTDITDEGIKSLVGLSNLQRLNVAKTKVTDDALVYLAAHPNLVYLNLYGTQVTDDGIGILANLPNLQHLYLWQTGATKEGAEELESHLTGLEVNLGTE